jgi:hypothetical protein
MSDITLAGSCLCGSVAYELRGDARRFFHCHCERCRKSSGGAHASNIILKLQEITWTAGEQLTRRYKVPEAERFAVVFCSECGSPLPRVSPDGKIAVVPAGSLDHEPDVRPQARIFAGSRAEWSCDGSEIPTHVTYPPPP